MVDGERSGVAIGEDLCVQAEELRSEGSMPPAAMAVPAIHVHEECGFRERLWLDREQRSPASAALHPYCVSCGTVKDLTLPRARPLGFYLAGIARLREYLGRSTVHPKLAQVQSHLIAQRLAASGEFDDPYGTPGRLQLEAYVDAVRTVRPDVDEEIVLRMLPALRARRIHTALEAMQGDANAAHPGN